MTDDMKKLIGEFFSELGEVTAAARKKTTEISELNTRAIFISSAGRVPKQMQEAVEEIKKDVIEVLKEDV